MREIKFRAWLKEHKSMIDVMEIDIDNQTIFYYWFGDHDGHFENFNKIDLMEYTGLKDKNNKEIYEGDIVIHHNKMHKIIFNAEEARFVLRDDEFELEIPFTNNNNKRMEVVGNIYENSELIKEVR